MIYQQSQSKVQFTRFKEQEYLPHQHQGFATLAVHEGSKPEKIFGSVVVPIHMCSTFAQKDIGQPYGRFDYTRGGNPTRFAVEQCLAAIQYGKYCITFASGCGATAAILHTLHSGDHVIACDDVYGGTQRYMRMYARDKFNIEVDFVDMTKLELIEQAIKPNTKIIWIETPTNPTMKMVDIESVSQLAKKNNLISVCDNTFASPYLQSPLLIGADISYNSCTKYLGGHSDIVMGCIVTNNEQLYKKIYHVSYSMGANPSPFDCFLLHRGIKSLECRMKQSTCNAYHLAHWMEKQEYVEAVLYPGLKSHPQHQIANKQMRGYGGMISFRLKGGKQQTTKFLKAVKIFTLAQSLGGIQSLAQCPAFMTHASVPLQTRIALGITENLIRLSVGIQSTEDIIKDIDQALKASQTQ